MFKNNIIIKMKMLLNLIYYTLFGYIISIKIKNSSDKISEVVKATLTKYHNPELDTDKIFTKCSDLITSDKASEGAMKDYYNHLNNAINTPNTYPSLEKLNNYLKYVLLNLKK